MSNLHQIRYIEQRDIDKQKWDRCIHQAANGLIYGYSIYLDHMAVHWDALVLNDYQAVMPITWNKKYGFYYIFQPFLCASLGVFGNELNADVVGDFLKAIPRRFRLWEFSLNHGNLFRLPNFAVKQVGAYLKSAIPHHQLLTANSFKLITANEIVAVSIILIASRAC